MVTSTNFITMLRPDLEVAAPDRREIHPSIVSLVMVMDESIQIPGTTFRIGLDGIIGLVPVVGDLFTAFVGRLLLKEADRLGVSRWTKARMYFNYLIDTVVGMIPIVGDAFDFAFKAHRRNLRLLQAHLDKQARREPGHDRTAAQAS
jgi:hypothetical protein